MRNKSLLEKPVTGGSGHTQGTDVALGAVGEKNPPIDADKAIYRDSTTSDALVTSTWTQVKAFLKTYFDTLYNKYVHPNHTGAVTSTGDGATAITDKAVTLPKMADMATASLLGRNTAATGVPEVLAKATALSLLNVEDGATADQTGAEIKAAYEAEADTNAYDDAAVSKLAGIEAGAEVNNISNVNALDLTDGGDTTLHDHAGISENIAARHLDTDAIKWAIVFGG